MANALRRLEMRAADLREKLAAKCWLATRAAG